MPLLFEWIFITFCFLRETDLFNMLQLVLLLILVIAVFAPTKFGKLNAGAFDSKMKAADRKFGEKL